MFKNLLLLFTSSLIALLICELILHLWFPQHRGPVRSQRDQTLGVINIPRLKGFVENPGIFKFTFEHNELGFRKTAKVENNFKRSVLLLGDSFTYGTGVDNEKTFAYLLQDAFIKDSIRIFNGAHGGTGTDYALKVLQTIGEKLAPEIVIYMAFPNDFTDNLKETYYHIQDSVLLPKKLILRDPLFSDTWWYSWLKQHSHLFSLLRQMSINVQVSEKDKLDYYYSKTEIRNRSFEITTAYLDELQRICIRKGIPFFINYIPSEIDLAYQQDSSVVSPFRLFFENYTTAHNIPFHDFSTDMLGANTPYEYYYFSEGHWNEKAHYLASQILIEQVEDYLQKPMSPAVSGSNNK